MHRSIWRCAALAVLAACQDKANFTNVVVTPMPAVEREWTVAVFLAADNDLAKFGIDDIDKMEAGGVDPRVGVVVQAEFSPRHLAAINCDSRCFNRPNFDTFRYVITGEGADVPGPNGPTIDIGNRNMTDPAELREFVQWVKANHPAKRLLVVLWNHGGGFQGLLVDETSAPEHIMEISDLPTALRNDPVNVLDFDMCLMGGYEVLAQLSGNTAFTVFSQETIPAGGHPYTQIIRRMNANPTADAATVAAIWADEYAAFYAGTEQSTTISAYDLGGFREFERALDQLAGSLHGNLTTLFPSITAAAAGAQRYAASVNKDLVNLLDSLDVRVADPTIHAQIATLRAQTIDPEFRLRNHFSTGTAKGENNVDRSNGLSIVLPSGDGIDVFDAIGTGSFANYQAQVPTKAWTAFLVDYVALLPPITPTQAPTGSTQRCVAR